MKRRKKTNVRRTSKRNRRPATQASQNGAGCCGLLYSISRTISPVLKALGIGKLK
jgi:hypothetical protein